MQTKKWENILWIILTTMLGFVCFPANPLIFTGVIEADSYLALVILGSVAWVFGMVLVMAPIITFPRRGRVPEGKPFVNTTCLVDTGIYALVRHPQYTGGVFSILLTTIIMVPALVIRGAWCDRHYGCLHEL